MNSSAFHEILNQMVRLQKIIWWAFTSIVIVYAAPLYGEDQRLVFEPVESMATLESLFTLLSFLLAGGAYLYRQRALASERLRQILSEEVIPKMIRTDFPRADDKDISQIEALPQDEQRQIRLVQKLTGKMIISLTMHEIIVLLGFLLALQTNDLMSFVPFAVAMISLNLFIYPKPEQVLQRLQMNPSEKAV